MHVGLYNEHLGSPYQMGYAHGELMKETAQHLVSDVWDYMKTQVVRAAPLLICSLYLNRSKLSMVLLISSLNGFSMISPILGIISL